MAILVIAKGVPPPAQILERRKAAEQSVHLTGGILRHFRALSTPEQNPALGVLSTPAHPQVTQTVGQQRRQSDVL